MGVTGGRHLIHSPHCPASPPEVMAEHQQSGDKDPKLTRREDLLLVNRIVDGSLVSWHEFLERYSGLILEVLRRRLYAADEDEIRTVYADILKSLYNVGFAKFEGRSRLSTWLIVYTRSRAVDYFRRKFGRIRLPKGFKRLGEFDREVLRLYFIEHLPMDVVVSTLRWSGHEVIADDIVESVWRIVEVVDRRFLCRYDNEYSARRYGIDSVRMFSYLLNQRCEYESMTGRGRPDARILEEEAAETAKQALDRLSALQPDERKVIYMKFYRGWSARRIADRLGISSPRRVYHIINNALKKLRGP